MSLCCFRLRAGFFAVDVPVALAVAQSGKNAATRCFAELDGTVVDALDAGAKEAVQSGELLFVLTLRVGQGCARVAKDMTLGAVLDRVAVLVMSFAPLMVRNALEVVDEIVECVPFMCHDILTFCGIIV